MLTQQRHLNQQIAQCQAEIAQCHHQRRTLERQLLHRWQTPLLTLAGIWAGGSLAAAITPATPPQMQPWQVTPATAWCVAACQMMRPSNYHQPMAAAETSAETAPKAPAAVQQLGGLALWLAWYNKPLWWWELWRWLRSHRPRPPSKTPTIARQPPSGGHSAT